MTLTKKENINISSHPAVIFDVDGVLVDTVPFHFQAWKKVFTEEGIAFSKTEYQKINGLPRDAAIRRILKVDPSVQHIKDIGDRKQRYYLELITKNPPQPLPGIQSFLPIIRRGGWTMGAASSSKNALVVLQTAQLAENFEVIITGYDFKHPKPHPDIFLTAAKLLGTLPAKTIVIEDAVNGVRAAVAGGFLCIGIANSESADELGKAGASIVVNVTSDLTIDLLHKFIFSQSSQF